METFCYKDTIEVGLDEAGRGPLFGRVYMAAVILPPDDSFDHSLMKDSKKLSEKKRVIAEDYIKNNAIDWVVNFKEERYIDKHNIFAANYNGMHEAINKLLVKPEHILVDGNYFKPHMFHDGEYISHTTVVKGRFKIYIYSSSIYIGKSSKG